MTTTETEGPFEIPQSIKDFIDMQVELLAAVLQSGGEPPDPNTLGKLLGKVVIAYYKNMFPDPHSAERVLAIVETTKYLAAKMMGIVELLKQKEYSQ